MTSRSFLRSSPQVLTAAEAERERKRLRRLLRNRVSAQLARERKKQQALQTESRAMQLEAHTAALAQRVSTLERENAALRQARLCAAAKACAQLSA